MKLKVWYKYCHDQYAVEEIILEDISPADEIAGWKQDGGVRITSTQFVPWHSISYVEVVGEG